MPKDFVETANNALEFANEHLSTNFIQQDNNAPLRLGIESIKKSAENLKEKPKDVDLAIILAKDINYTHRIAASLPPESRGRPQGRPKYESLLLDLSKKNKEATHQGPAIQAAGEAQYLIDYVPLKAKPLNPQTEKPVIAALAKLRDDSKKLALEVMRKTNDKPYDAPDVEFIKRDFDIAINELEKNIQNDKNPRNQNPRKPKNTAPARPVYKKELEEAKQQFIDSVEPLTTGKKVSLTPEIQEAAKLAMQPDENYQRTHQTSVPNITKNTDKSIV